MSALQITVRDAIGSFGGVSFTTRFWNWWIGLYADAPRRPLPCL